MSSATECIDSGREPTVSGREPTVSYGPVSVCGLEQGEPEAWEIRSDVTRPCRETESPG
jgi:hypothetical protein